MTALSSTSESIEVTSSTTAILVSSSFISPPSSTGEGASGPPSNSIPIGAIAGGTVGGLTGIIVLLFLFFCCRRNRREASEVASQQGNVEKASVLAPPQDSGQGNTSHSTAQRETHIDQDTFRPRDLYKEQDAGGLISELGVLPHSSSGPQSDTSYTPQSPNHQSIQSMSTLANTSMDYRLSSADSEASRVGFHSRNNRNSISKRPIVMSPPMEDSTLKSSSGGASPSHSADSGADLTLAQRVEWLQAQVDRLQSPAVDGVDAAPPPIYEESSRPSG